MRTKIPLQHLQSNVVYIPHHLVTVLAEMDLIIFPLSQRVIRIKIIYFEKCKSGFKGYIFMTGQILFNGKLPDH